MMTLGHTLDRQPVHIDLEKLVEGRLMAQANSGAGKSWLLRRLLEQTAGKIQHIIIDVEDEFHTLREKHDYILAGRDGGDCPADRRSAELLARRLLELGMSAVISIYEMKPGEREEFVRLFLESLISAPRSLWHPALIVIDEAHLFAPEGGKSETTGAVVDLMARGRKRGYAGVLATQRLSKINKDAIAEVNNKLIGRAALDVDMKRSGDELGFDKSRQLYLRTLPAGRFFAFGPALSMNVVEMEVGPVVTTHPKAGQRSAPATPPPDKVKAVLQQLANLPKEAEQQARTAEELRAQVRKLEAELRKASSSRPVPLEPKTVEVSVLTDDDRELLKSTANLFSGIGEAAETFRLHSVLTVEAINRAAVKPLHKPAASLPERPARVHQPAAPVHKARPVAHSSEPSVLSGPEKRILDAIAWLESIGVESPEQTAVAFLAGYTIGGGAFNNPRGRLNQRGLVEYAGDCIRLTAEGRGLANTPDTPLTSEDLHAKIMERLPGPEQKLLRVLIGRYPESISNEDLARQSGYAQGGGAYNNPRGRLRTLGLIEYQSGKVRARDILFL